MYVYVTYQIEKMITITTVDKIHTKCHGITGSRVNVTKNSFYIVLAEL